MSQEAQRERPRMRRALRVGGLCLAVLSVVGFAGEVLQWWTFQTYCPWAVLAVLGIVLLLSEGEILGLVKSVKVLGTEVNLHREETRRQGERIESIEGKVNLMHVRVESLVQQQGQSQDQQQTQQVIGGLNVNLPPSYDSGLIRAIVQATLQGSARAGRQRLNLEDDAQKTILTSERQTYKPSYLVAKARDKGVEQ